MKQINRIIAILLFACFIPSVLWAQTGTTASSTTTSAAFDTEGFPQWAKDLRRGEIVAFGSFPFAYLVANFTFDSYRFATNGWDRRYAPKPFNAAGTIQQTQSQKLNVIWIAAGGAIAVALVDYGIVRYRRNRAERETRSLPGGTPIIIRRPLGEEEDDTSATGNPGAESN